MRTHRQSYMYDKTRRIAQRDFHRRGQNHHCARQTRRRWRKVRRRRRPGRVDACGQHIMACPYSGAHRRHEYLQGALIHCIRQAGCPARRATVKELRAPGDTSQKKADVVADNFANASRTTLFDVVVVHPSISSFKTSYDRAGAAAADRGQRKDKKYKELAESLDYLFTDFAVETYGRMSEAARKVIKQLGDMYEQLHGGDESDGYIPRSVFVDHCRQIIGVALQRAVCTQITNNVKSRKGVGSTRDNMDLCSSLPLTGRL